MNLFGFNWGSGSQSNELPEIFPIPILQSVFVEIDVANIFKRILIDVAERTQGINPDEQKLLWDNCLGSEVQDGLISQLAKAMVQKADLCLVYDRTVRVVRPAKDDEAREIRADYEKKNESSKGIFIRFHNFRVVDMIKFYSAMEFCAAGGLYKSMNLSKALQIKLSDLRASTGLNDSDVLKAQMVLMAQALNEGKSIGLDAKDIVETAKPDLTATDSALRLIAQKQSMYLGLPASWVTGELQGGMSDTGKADAAAVERGLKPYYVSIFQPVVEALFTIKTTFKSDDFEMLSTANETLKTFELTSNDFVSMDNKLQILNKLYGLPASAKGDPPKPVEPGIVDPKNPNAPPVDPKAKAPGQAPPPRGF